MPVQPLAIDKPHAGVNPFPISVFIRQQAKQPPLSNLPAMVRIRLSAFLTFALPFFRPLKRCASLSPFISLT